MSQVCEVLKYEGDNSTFIWKHPSEDFNSLTQLIVHESQEAIFFLNGQALDLFGPGRYTLETQNIPKVGGFLKRATGDVNPFHCEVYFVNTAVQMGLKWGTDSKVRYIDPDSGIPIELGASGELNMQVSDSRKLLVKLVGTMKGIAWEERGAGFTKSIQNSFRPLIATAVKSNLSQAIKAEEFDILEVDEHLEDISRVLHEKIKAGFEEYGLSVPQFYLTTVVLPEGDPNFKRLRELHTISIQARMIKANATVRTARAQAEAGVNAAERQAELEKQLTATEVARREAERRVIAAEAEAQALRAKGLSEAEIMAAKGYTQKDVIHGEVEKARFESIGKIKIGPDVVNGGGGGGASSGIVGDVLGLGVGMAAASTIMPQFREAFAGMQPQQPGQSPKMSDEISIFRAKVEKLTIMKESGLISDEEYAQMRSKLLSEVTN